MTTEKDREQAAVEAVRIRARRLGAGKHATAWGTLGARNAIKAGESGHRAIELGMERVMDMLEAME